MLKTILIPTVWTRVIGAVLALSLATTFFASGCGGAAKQGNTGTNTGANAGEEEEEGNEGGGRGAESQPSRR